MDASGALVKAPVAGGAPQTVFTGGVYNEPQMSPDGSSFLWWYPFDSTYGPATFVGELTSDGQFQGRGTCIGCTMTDGWMGSTPLASFPGGATGDGSPSRICALAPSGSAACAQPLVADARGDLWFPAGSPDGTEIAAALSIPAGGTNTAGRIALYSVASGALIRDVTTGAQDTTPQFSPDGHSIVFERAGQIVTHNLATGAETVLGSGVYPFWGAAGGTAGGSGGSGLAPKAALSTARGRGLRWVARHRSLAVVCRLSGAGQCAVSASIAASSARRLHLKVGGHARSYALGHGSVRLLRAGQATMTIKLSAGAARALGRVHSLRLTLNVHCTASGAHARTQVARVTLHS